MRRRIRRQEKGFLEGLVDGIIGIFSGPVPSSVYKPSRRRVEARKGSIESRANAADYKAAPAPRQLSMELVAPVSRFEGQVDHNTICHAVVKDIRKGAGLLIRKQDLEVVVDDDMVIPDHEPDVLLPADVPADVVVKIQKPVYLDAPFTSRNKDLLKHVVALREQSKKTGEPAILPFSNGQTYNIIRALGQGGMGAVYQAHRINVPLMLPSGVRQLLFTAMNDPRLKPAQLVDYLSQAGVERIFDRLVHERKLQAPPVDRVVSPDDKYTAVRNALLSPRNAADLICEHLDPWNMLRLYYAFKRAYSIEPKTDPLPVEIFKPNPAIDVALKKSLDAVLNHPLNEEGVLKLAASTKPEIQRGIETELAAANKVGQTQYVAKRLGAGNHDGSNNLAIFFNLIRGIDMLDEHNLLVKNKQFNPVEKLALAYNHLLQGLMVVHGEGLSHGDVCGNNARYSTSQGFPCLVDFGVACAQKLGVIAGKPAYMPRDILIDQEKDPNERRKQRQAGDVYALSTLFYYLLTGTLPYPDRKEERGKLDYASWKALKSDPANYDLLKPYELCPDIPEKFSELIYAGLDPEWHRRPTAFRLEQMSRDLYLFDGSMPSGITMGAIATWFDKLSPGKYDEKFLQTRFDKDTKDPVLDNIKKFVLAKYRQANYNVEGVEYDFNGWARLPKRKKFTPIEDNKKLHTNLREQYLDQGIGEASIDKHFPTGINYQVGVALRPIKEAISTSFVEMMTDVYKRRLTQPEFEYQHSFLRNTIGKIEDNPSRAFDVFLEIASSELRHKYKDSKMKEHGPEVGERLIQQEAMQCLLGAMYEVVDLQPEVKR
jgi:serine/threonine protein kinase